MWGETQTACEEMVFEVPADVSSIADARDAAVHWASRHAPSVTDDLALVVSELVTNAAVHGPPGEAIALHLQSDEHGAVRGEVVDQGDASADVGRREPGVDNGFGLHIVDRVSSSWGVREGSTVVWFVIDAR